MHFSTTLAALAFFSLANAAVIGKRSLAGEATTYGGNTQGGACSFSTYTIPSNIFGTALSDSNWANSANCGACISVTGPAGNSITAMIVDECPGCGINHLDLFPTAFTSLVDLSTGIIDVTWSYVDCPITSPLQLYNKEGVSAYCFSMQVVNANKAVSALEVSKDGGSTWQGTTRQTYNFFEYSSGFGTTIVDIRVTSSDGDVVIVNNVEVSSGKSVMAGSNFGGSAGTSSASVAFVVASSSSSSSAVLASFSTQNASPISALAVSTPVPEAVGTSTNAGANFQEVSSSASPIFPTTAVVPTPSLATSTPTTSVSSSLLASETTYVYVDACKT